jgi:DNA-binding response OmpR family regulator
MPVRDRQDPYLDHRRAFLKDAEQYVLVVDDDAVCRSEVLDLLDAAGIVASGSGDGTDARAQVRLHRPSVILLDVSAPRLGCVQLGRVLRVERGLGEIPTISMWDSSENFGCIGGQGPVLCKPMDSRFLLRLVRSYLGR